MPENLTGVEEDSAELPDVISLDGAKIPLAVVDPEGIQSVLEALNLTPPFGYMVESIKIVYKLAAKK